MGKYDECIAYAVRLLAFEPETYQTDHKALQQAVKERFPAFEFSKDRRALIRVCDRAYTMVAKNPLAGLPMFEE